LTFAVGNVNLGTEVMMQYHIDREVDRLMVKLADALCTFEREGGRGSVLVLVPYEPDEEIVVLASGKPASTDHPSDPILALARAYENRSPNGAKALTKAAPAFVRR
jgi:hypothetical protein